MMDLRLILAALGGVMVGGTLGALALALLIGGKGRR